MMNTIFMACLLLLTAFPANAADVVHLAVDIDVDGAQTMSSKITTRFNHRASLSQSRDDGEHRERLLISVTPFRRQNPQEILLKFRIVAIKNRRRTLLSRPKLITLNGQPASLTFDSSKLTLHVLASFNSNLEK